MLSGKSLAAIVAPEVAGSRPVSHPISLLAPTLTETTQAQAVSRRAVMARAVQYQEVIFRRGKKEGAIHAPVRCVSGLGLMAFRGHLKHPCRPDMLI